MNEANPFQVPAWSRINREQRRRERFKRTVIVTVAVSVLGLVASLLVSIKTELAAKQLPPAADPEDVPVAATPAVVPAPSQTTVAVSNEPTTVYVVKTGDTLTGIARAHGTTIKAMESANSLTSDRILIGEKLKIPTAAAAH